VACARRGWIIDSLQFFRQLQEHLIFSLPGGTGAERKRGGAGFAALWGDTPDDGIFPRDLRASRMREFLSSHPQMRGEWQILGDDLSSQVTRVALHAAVLLSARDDDASADATAAICPQPVEHMCVEYIRLLAAAPCDEDGASADLSLLAEYTSWLPVDAQAETLERVLGEMPTVAWQQTLYGEPQVLQPAVVAKVLQSIVAARVRGDGDVQMKLEALEFACSPIIADEEGGVLARMQGLRELNRFLRHQLLATLDGQTGVGRGGAGSIIDPTLLNIGAELCLAEAMLDNFTEIRHVVRAVPVEGSVCEEASGADSRAVAATAGLQLPPIGQSPTPAAYGSLLQACPWGAASASFAEWCAG
jgi:hypothetical protein